MALLEGWLDDVYADFTAKAAEDRGMDVEALRSLARGRVWTGADAAANGLVDELGGLARAVEVACRLAGLDRADVDVRPFPKQHPLAALLPAENSDAAAARLPATPGSLLGLTEGPPAWRALLGDLAVLAGTAHLGVLSLPRSVLAGLLPGS